MSQDGVSRLEGIVRTVVIGAEGRADPGMKVLAAELRTHPNLLLEALRWKKLLKRVPSSSTSSGVRPTNALGDWYADILFTEPAWVICVSERSLVSVLLPARTLSSLVPRLGWRSANCSCVWASRTNRIGRNAKKWSRLLLARQQVAAC